MKFFESNASQNTSVLQKHERCGEAQQWRQTWQIKEIAVKELWFLDSNSGTPLIISEFLLVTLLLTDGIKHHTTVVDTSVNNSCSGCLFIVR